MSELFDALPVQVSLDRQRACVRREIGKRNHVYPRLVGAGKLKQYDADKELAAMNAVAATLESVAKYEAFIGTIARMTPGGDHYSSAEALDRLIDMARALIEKPE